jgi:uncharacterized protein (DUF1697 family)
MNHAWVALLRGINLAGRNRVSMPELRQALSAAGYEDVRTYIASGNVLLRAPKGGRAALARRLEELVRETSGVTSPVVLRKPAELAKVVEAHPFGRDTSKTHVVFLADRPRAAAVREVAAADVAPDRIEIAGSEVYLLHPNGQRGSRVKQSLLDRLGVGTARNFRTVTKLAELAADL